MEEDFKAIVEQATGRQVQAFLSNSYLDASVSVEIFLISGAVENMQAFEVEVDEPGGRQPRGQHQLRFGDSLRMSSSTTSSDPTDRESRVRH
jgi:hypothetical protein